jgi:peptide/nickel transport system substrate-binding protein
MMTVAGPFGGPLGPSAVRRVTTRYAGQVFGAPQPEIDHLFLNARRLPFADHRARRALDYAVDRRKLVELAGGSELAQLTCQFMPPGFPGYRPFCPQTVGATTAGTWTAPNLTLARRLIEQSGTKGSRVQVWTWPEREPIARYVASLLRRLGYRASLREFGDTEAYYDALHARGPQPDVGPNGWFADHLAPSNIVRPNFSCEAARAAPPIRSFSGFCDPGIDAVMERALAEQGRDPRVANRLWAQVDRQLVKSAASIPTFNRRSVVLVSKRVDNEQWHPLWGPLLDQLSVR